MNDPYRAASRRYQPVVVELLTTFAAILVYFLVRANHPDDVPASVQRSLDIVRLEQELGIFYEASIQQFFLPHQWTIDLANTVYVWGMYPVLLAVGVWLALTDLSHFRYVRNVMLVSAMIGIVGYWVLPAAPPRLLGPNGFPFGFVDTLHSGTQAVQDYQPGFFLNPYAALPSFHFAWVALASIVVWTHTGSALVRAAAAVLSAMMFWAIVVTANHLFFDMVLGVVTVAVAGVVTEGGYRLARRSGLGAHPERPSGLVRPRLSSERSGG